MKEDKIHLRVKGSKREPYPLCNAVYLGALTTFDPEECNCVSCLKSYNGHEETRIVDRLFKKGRYAQYE